MRNTKKEYSIKERNIKKKGLYIGGIGVFALLAGLTISSLKTNKNKDGEDRYGYYSISYLDAKKNMDESNFDQNFINLYNKDNISIGDNSYSSRSIYIVKNNDDSVYLIKAGENTTDLLTGKEFEYDRKNICLFKDSTIYANLYDNGKLNEDLKFDPSDLTSLIQTWDGEKHDKTPELYAEKQASEAYIKKYGR